MHYKSPDRILPEWAIQPWSPSTEREKERKSESESERERERERERASDIGRNRQI